MKINNRLKKIADLVDKDAKVMDVGCDHALLVYLINYKRKKDFLLYSIRYQRRPPKPSKRKYKSLPTARKDRTALRKWS